MAKYDEESLQCVFPEPTHWELGIFQRQEYMLKYPTLFALEPILLQVSPRQSPSGPCWRTHALLSQGCCLLSIDLAGAPCHGPPCEHHHVVLPQLLSFSIAGEAAGEGVPPLLCAQQRIFILYLLSLVLPQWYVSTGQGSFLFYRHVS